MLEITLGLKPKAQGSPSSALTSWAPLGDLFNLPVLAPSLVTGADNA